MREKQLEALKRGRETKALRAQQKKLEKNEIIEPLEDSGKIQEKVIDIQENSGEILEEDKPQPLLRQRKKKEVKEEVKEVIEEVKLTPKERLAQMRLQKKLELEEKKLELEELKMNKMIDDENKKIQQLRTIKTEEVNEHQQKDTIFIRPYARRPFGGRQTRFL